MPRRNFTVTGTRPPDSASAARTAAADHVAEQPSLVGQCCAAAVAGHLRSRAPEVHVDVVDPVLCHQSPDGLAEGQRVGAVQLERADALRGMEPGQFPRGCVALEQRSGGHHLVDEQPAPERGAQHPEGRVGHTRHRGEHDRWVDGERAQAQGPGGDRRAGGARWPTSTPSVARADADRHTPAPRRNQMATTIDRDRLAELLAVRVRCGSSRTHPRVGRAAPPRPGPADRRCADELDDPLARRRSPIFADRRPERPSPTSTACRTSTSAWVTLER